MEFRITRTSQWDDEKPKEVKGIYKKDGYWYVKIDTLEELIDFYNQYGDLIIQQDWHNKKEMRIEIYDNYRE